jgi:hypothetical protein
MACRMTAPGLVQVFHRYKSRGVAFVSLTDVPREGVAFFAQQFAVPWPCGYGASHGSIARFGAYSSTRWSPAYHPGHEVSPTLYLLGPDGRVLWNDGQARPRHLTRPQALVRELELAIERALGQPGRASDPCPPSRTPPTRR